jgi:hypothetical protein
MGNLLHAKEEKKKQPRKKTKPPPFKCKYGCSSFPSPPTSSKPYAFGGSRFGVQSLRFK